MTPQQVIEDARESASEWIEMCDNPAAVVAGVLAGKIVEMSEYIDYLERRLEYVSSSKSVG